VGTGRLDSSIAVYLFYGDPLLIHSDCFCFHIEQSQLKPKKAHRHKIQVKIIRKHRKQKKGTHSSDIRWVRVLEEAMHLLNSELHGEEFVEEAECRGGPTAVSSHPRLHMVHLVVNLVYDFMVRFKPEQLLKIITWEYVHAQHLLH
jgi:hypothetical protein